MHIVLGMQSPTQTHRTAVQVTRSAFRAADTYHKPAPVACPEHDPAYCNQCAEDAYR
jgi:hypothetical protein